MQTTEAKQNLDRAVAAHETADELHRSALAEIAEAEKRIAQADPAGRLALRETLRQLRVKAKDALEEVRARRDEVADARKRFAAARLPELDSNAESARARLTEAVKAALAPLRSKADELLGIEAERVALNAEPDPRAANVSTALLTAVETALGAGPNGTVEVEAVKPFKLSPDVAPLGMPTEAAEGKRFAIPPQAAAWAVAKKLMRVVETVNA